MSAILLAVRSESAYFIILSDATFLSQILKVVLTTSQDSLGLLGTFIQGWHQDFPAERLTLPTRGLKYRLPGTIDAKNLRKESSFPF